MEKDLEMHETGSGCQSDLLGSREGQDTIWKAQGAVEMTAYLLKGCTGTRTQVQIPSTQVKSQA